MGGSLYAENPYAAHTVASLKDIEQYEFSADAAAKVQALKSRYPDTKSVVMPALYIAQEELGWLPDVAICWVGEQLGLPRSHVISVATFYTIFYKKPVGRDHLQICRTLSCMLCGARDLTTYIKERLATNPHEVTEDGLWSYEEVECLGSCGSAPMVEINDVFFENLTPEKLGAVMDRIESEQPNLRYSQKGEALAEGFSDRPKSEVLPREGA